MQHLRDDTMHVLESAIEKYAAADEATTESAVRDLLADVRHYCDLHEIDFEERLEGSLDLYLEEQDGCDCE